MQDKDNLRQAFTVYILICYLLPILLFSGYSIQLMPPQKSWGILTFGIFLAICGSLVLMLKMWKWESTILEQMDLLAESKVAMGKTEKQENLPFTYQPLTAENEILLQSKRQVEQLEQALADSHMQHKETVDQIRSKVDEIHHLTKEKEDLQIHLEQLRQELVIYQQTSREQIKQKDVLLAEYAQTVNDLRGTMEKKQQQIVKLESSVRDLTYEVKTLLQLSDIDLPAKDPVSASVPHNLPIEESPIPRPPYGLDNTKSHKEPLSIKDRQLHSHQEASFQLKRCIDIAQKLTGASHFGISSRFRDLSIDSYALEQRRLFDSLHSENSSLVLVYSQKDDKLLFVNNHSKNLLGWSPEKFIQDFPDLIQTSLGDWKKALSSLSTTPETQIRLLIKTRSGQEQPIQCHLGVIPTGIFKNHVIGVLFS